MSDSKEGLGVGGICIASEPICVPDFVYFETWGGLYGI